MADVHKTIDQLLQEVAELRLQINGKQADYERRYRSLFEQSTDAILIIDLNGTYQEINHRAAEMLGYTVAEITGMSFQDIVASSHQSVIQNLMGLLMENKPIPICECVLVRKNGDEFPVEISVGMVRDDTGTPLYIQSIVRDISIRTQVEIALKASENRFRFIVETAQDAIYIKDQNRVYTHVNPTVEKQNGKAADEIIGKTDLALFGAEADAQMKVSDERVLAGEVVEQELSKLMHDGIHVFHTIKVPVRDHADNIVGLCGIARDITDRLQAEHHRLELALEREKTKILTEFVQNASHEFRTPLAVIHMALHLLTRSTDAEIQARKSAQIDAQLVRLNRLVDMLLILAKLDSEITLIEDAIEINNFCKEVVWSYQNAAIAKQISFTLELSPAAIMISSDMEYLRQAIVQILDNAIRFTADGGTITVRTYHRGDCAIIEISDTGSGIKPEHLPHIFKRFWRQDLAHSTPGFGLGLPIAQRSVEAHKGHIDVESEVGKGSTFKLFLPL